MKILIVDKLSPRTVQRLEAAGHQVRTQVGLEGTALAQAIGDADVLVVRSTKVPAAVLEASPSLSLVIRAGAGVNTIDVAAASRRGVYVSNCPGKNTDAVAELTIGMMIAADRRLVDAVNDLRAGKWRKGEYGKAKGLRGRTLGILGFGAIGRRVAEIAQSLGMQVVAWSRSLTPECASRAGVGFCTTPVQVASLSHVLSVHVAATDETRGLVSREVLLALPDEATLINTARGDVIDDAALRELIDTKRLRVAADVFEGEPSGSEAVFADVAWAAKVIGTPHIGASTDQASEAIADEVVRIVEVYAALGRPPGAVNLETRSAANHQLVVRHLNQVGVLAAILDELRREGINVREMDNVIFQKGAAACCTLKLDSPPSSSLLERLQRISAHLSVQLEKIA